MIFAVTHHVAGKLLFPENSQNCIALMKRFPGSWPNFHFQSALHYMVRLMFIGEKTVLFFLNKREAHTVYLHIKIMYPSGALSTKIEKS